MVRIEEAGLGVDAQVRLVVSRVSDPDGLRSTWASSGATVEAVGPRLRATTTVAALARAAGRRLAAGEAEQLDHALRSAVASWGGPAPPVGTGEHPLLATDTGPLVMGVVNVTPDSFSDGGLLFPQGHPETAVNHAEQLVEQGADVLDIGGESSRPGAEPVDEDEELRRVLPVLERLSALPVPRSIDTTKPAVARAALEAGATIVNDVSGAADPALLETVAEAGAGYVLMHTRGRPADMAQHAAYSDIVAEVYEFLADGLARCTAAGIPREHILIDPGIGFAKAAEHSVAVLRAVRQFRGLGRPVLVGASRKSFLGALLEDAGPEARFEASLACAALAVAGGVSVVRAHDVAETVRVARVANALSRDLPGKTPSETVDEDDDPATA